MSVDLSAPVRFSRLKKMGQSPAHYFADVPPKSSAVDIGSAADLILFARGERRIIAYPGPVRRGKEWEAFRDDNQDALILTARELDIAEGIVASIKKHPEAMRVLDGELQRNMRWMRGSRECSGTPDVIVPGKFITDLKTGATSDPRRFPWHMRAMGYHAQLAWYREGAFEVFRSLCTDCYIVAAEQKAPYVVTVFRLTESVLDMGSRLARLWFEQLLVCEASGEWPGYAGSVVDLDLPDNDVEIEITSAGEEEGDSWK